ncbi:MAG: hypothetical protein HYX29_08270 [Solirubrobacterales bacterium]|nr:hypothetical protein [Solirubrobacterales bacterium]
MSGPPEIRDADPAIDAAAEVEGRVMGYAYAAPHASRDSYRWACSTAIYHCPTRDP